MMRGFKVDLHIHTCLSPCGDASMIPPAIVSRARESGLDAIGIADHNSAANVAAVREAGRSARLSVLGGMEVTSREEIHLLVFLDGMEELASMQEFVYDGLAGTNDPAHFGEQLIVDEEGTRIGVTDRLLIGRTDHTVGAIVRAAHDRAGLVIGSHVDRPSFGLFSQLGFLPEDLELDAVEISLRFPGGGSAREELLKKAGAQRLPWVGFSDAHFLDDIGAACTEFWIQAPTVGELRRALREEGGRGIRR